MRDGYLLQENRRLQEERISGGYTNVSRLEDPEVERRSLRKPERSAERSRLPAVDATERPAVDFTDRPTE